MREVFYRMMAIIVITIVLAAVLTMVPAAQRDFIRWGIFAVAVIAYIAQRQR